jgi:hypothetical protein
MTAHAPSPPVVRGGHPSLPVEALQELLGGLLHERERLRAGDDREALEENRRAIVRVQQELSQALVARYAA